MDVPRVSVLAYMSAGLSDRSCRSVETPGMAIAFPASGKPIKRSFDCEEAPSDSIADDWSQRREPDIGRQGCDYKMVRWKSVNFGAALDLVCERGAGTRD
jgi:hypothetical protein